MKSFAELDFWRGMSSKYSADAPFVKEPRGNRRPKDSPENFHRAADKWFFQRFGIMYRSQGVFVTSRELTAQAYAASPAHTMRIVPISAYRYCWSPNVSDLLFKAKEMADAREEAIYQFLIDAGYQDHSLEDAHATGHEVMIHCERFVAIPAGLLPNADPTCGAGQSAILLPFAN